MRNSIRLSEKYGVNPTIPICYLCGEEKNEIVLFGRRPNDVEAPKHACIDKAPCDKCKGYMEQGIILISVKSQVYNDVEPYRTGGWVVIKEEAAKRMFGDHVGKSRVAFVSDEAWDKIGLPRE